MTLLTYCKDLIRVTTPPVSRGKDFHFVESFKSARLHNRSDPRNIDDAVTHHSPVEREISCRDEPVGKVERQKPCLSRSLNLGIKAGIPPDVIYVNGNPEAFPKLITEIVRFTKCANAGTIRAIHRMEWLERQRYAGTTRVVKNFPDGVAHHASRSRQILGARWNPAYHEYQATCVELRRFVDGPTSIFDCGAPTSRVSPRKRTSSRKAGNHQPAAMKQAGRRRQS